MKKTADNYYPLNEWIKNRWSPLAFSDEQIPDEKVYSLIEAARWSASCFNEQPWRFLVGKKGSETYKKILESLVPKNQQWAKSAPLLIVNVAKTNFSHNDKPNRWSLYDLGQAVSSLVLQASSMDLFVHQMGGFDSEKVRSDFDIDESYEIISVMAVGKLGEIENLSDELRDRELSVKSIGELLIIGSDLE